MIRLLNISDASLYQATKLKSLQTDPLAFLSSYQKESQFPLDYFQTKIRHATSPPIFGIYAIIKNNNIIALAQLSKEFHPKKSHLANIYDVYVDPKFRGKNLAKKLLTHLIKKAKSYSPLEQLHLCCNSLNQPAIALYKSSGFTQIATRKNAVKEPDNTYQDELLFSLQLK